MRHRALVAYEWQDGLSNLHCSHWGALNLRPKHEITEETPFGGEDTDSDWAYEVLTELLAATPRRPRLDARWCSTDERMDDLLLGVQSLATDSSA